LTPLTKSSKTLILIYEAIPNKVTNLGENKEKKKERRPYIKNITEAWS
jgi:hypothetical protein